YRFCLPDSTKRMVGCNGPVRSIPHIGAKPSVIFLIEDRHKRPEGAAPVVGGIVIVGYCIVPAGFKKRGLASPVNRVLTRPMGNTGFDAVLVGPDARLPNTFSGKHMIGPIHLNQATAFEAAAVALGARHTFINYRLVFATSNIKQGGLLREAFHDEGLPHPAI